MMSGPPRRIGVVALAAALLALAPAPVLAAGSADSDPRIAPATAAATAAQAAPGPVARPASPTSRPSDGDRLHGLTTLLATFLLLVLGAVALCGWSWRKLRRRRGAGPWVGASHATTPAEQPLFEEDPIEVELQRMIAEQIATVAATGRRPGGPA